MPLRLGRRSFADDAYAIMAIINRTPDSFYDRGATYHLDEALDRVERVVAEGADILDVGGVKAGPGPEVSVAEELRRTVPLVEAIRARHPDIVISVDTWRSQVAYEVVAAGADLINDTWSGADPDVVRIVARSGAGLVCSHTGDLTPRTRPHRVSYADVVADVVDRVTALAERAVAAGVRRDGILIDPTHDFGKNTRHSLELTRRLNALVDTGWPVLVSVSNKDFVGESLDRQVGERLLGTLATTAVAAWQGARVFRAHNIRETREILDMVRAIRDIRPAVSRRGLA